MLISIVYYLNIYYSTLDSAWVINFGRCSSYPVLIFWWGRVVSHRIPLIWRTIQNPTNIKSIATNENDASDNINGDSTIAWIFWSRSVAVASDKFKLWCLFIGCVYLQRCISFQQLHHINKHTYTFILDIWGGDDSSSANPFTRALEIKKYVGANNLN